MTWLRPILGDLEYGFATLAPGAPLPAAIEPIATFAESEGRTIIAPAAQLADAGLPHKPGWALITIALATDLDATGITAAIATALAEAGIAANVVAAYHHDHLFVPWERRREALAILERLEAPR
ncbi:MAG: ACT domain-containing protein [Sphingomonadaceae bacterium]|nr:ACT domain-containing protein [Sphingomonadaceae bacterium]